jgi:hypothetical protein
MPDPLLDIPLTQEDKDRLKRLLPNIASQFEGMA